MTLMESLANPPRSKKAKCGTGDWIRARSSEEQASLHSAFSDPRWTTQDLLSVLQSQSEYPLKYNSLRVHRVGLCTCVAE